MAVSKTFAPEQIGDAYDAGLRLFGENRVQEFAAKKEWLSGLGGAQWHLIGHLQTNKAAKAVELFDAVDTVDSLKLAERLNAAATKIPKRLDVLIEVNVGGEAAKSGIRLGSDELTRLLEAAPTLAHVRMQGLMTIPPFSDNPEDGRPYFQKLRQLHDHIAAQSWPAVEMSVLSMGMSHDYQIAIEEGATCVRVGTAIFGERAEKP
jgi:pyridoxal phosphate enzyme (YggS family)